MTCVVAVKTVGPSGGKGVLMHADSGATSGETLSVPRADQKLFIACGSFLIGFCGSFRVGQILRQFLKIGEQPPGADHDFMESVFPTKLRYLLKEHGADFTEKGSDSLDDTALIVGYRGEIYVVMDDFQVARLALPYAAVGTGAPYALGAMHATYDPQMPEACAMRGMEAALAFAPGVRPPVATLRLELVVA